MDNREWYEIHDNLCLTADYMAEHGFSAKDLAYFVEKPYKFEDEFKKAQEAFDEEMAASTGVL